MYYDDGGAIPDNDADDAAPAQSNAGVPDPETDKMSETLALINQIMEKGRVSYGLPPNKSSSPVAAAAQYDPSAGAIPDESLDTSGDADPEVENPNTAPSLDEGGDPGETTEQVLADHAALDNEPAPQPQAQPGADDNSGAGPVVETPPDNSGAGPVVDRAEPRVLAYLQGAGAEQITPDDVARYVGTPNWLPNAGAIPENSSGAGAVAGQQQGWLPPDKQIEPAIVAAQKEGNGFGMTQLARKTYDSTMAQARAALQFGNLPDAVKLAQEAYRYAPDGVSAKFGLYPDGTVSAAITAPDGTTTTYGIPAKTFGELLNPGRGAQFDAVVHVGGVGNILQHMANKGMGGVATAGASSAGTGDEEDEGAPQQTTGPATVNVNGKNFRVPREQEGQMHQTPMQFARAHPESVTRFTGKTPTNGWGEPLSSKDERTTANQKSAEKLELVQAKAAGANETAKTRAGGTVEAAKIRAGASTQNAQTRAETQRQIAQLSHQDRLKLMDVTIEKARIAAARGDLATAGHMVDTAQMAAGGMDRALAKYPDLKPLVEKIRTRGLQANPDVSPPPAAPERQATPQQQAAPKPQYDRAAIEAEMKRRGLLQ